MDRSTSSHTWLMRSVYLGLALVILFFHLLPLQTTPRQWAPPDMLIAITFAWVMRRPDYVPSVVIGLAILTADLLLQRPPGLMAALIVAGSAYLQSRAAALSEASFAGEWFSVSVVLLAITLLNRSVLWLTSVATAPLILPVSQVVLTIVFYPLAVAISQYIFGVRKLAPSEAGSMGARS